MFSAAPLWSAMLVQAAGAASQTTQHALRAPVPPTLETDNVMDLGFVKDGDSTLMFTLTPPQTKDAGIEVSKGCYCFVIDVSGRCPPFCPRGPVGRRWNSPRPLLPSPTPTPRPHLAPPRVWPCTA